MSLPAYDQPDIHWDMPGLMWDEEAPPAVIRPMLKKIKLGISGASPTNTAAYAEAIVSSMTGNANFPTPDPAVATLAADAAAIRAKLTEITTTEADLKTKRDQLAMLTATAKSDVRKMANHVENKADGAVDKIHSAGFTVAGDPVATSPLTQVENLRMQISDNEGQLIARYNTVPGAAMYVLETSPSSEGPWTQAAITTRSTHTLTTLTPGTKYWVKVRALGASGVGPWSDPACRIAA